MPKQRIVQHPPPPPPPYIPPLLDSGTTLPAPQVTRRGISLEGGKADNSKPLPMLFGRVETPGSVRRVRFFADDMWVVRTLGLGQREATVRGGEAGGEIDSLVDMHTADGDPFAADPELATYFEHYFYTGSLTQVVHPLLSALDPSWAYNGIVTDWSGKLRGICYSIERYKLVYTRWTNGIPKWIFRIRGSKIFDPESGLTQYTDDAFMQWRFWELDPEGAYKYADQIAGFTEARAAVSTYYMGGLSYQSNFVIAGNASDIRKTFRTLTMSWFPPIGNKWTVIPDLPGDPVATLQEADLAPGDVTVEPSYDPDQVVNHVIVEITDTSHDVWVVAGPNGGKIEFKSDGLLAGTEEDRPATLSLPQVHNIKYGRAIARYQLYEYLGGMQVKVPWKAVAGPLQTGDMVQQRIDSIDRTYTGRIISRDKKPDGTYGATLSRFDARKWNNVLGAFAFTSVAPPSLPDPPVDTRRFVEWEGDDASAAFSSSSGLWAISDFEYRYSRVAPQLAFVMIYVAGQVDITPEGGPIGVGLTEDPPTNLFIALPPALQPAGTVRTVKVLGCMFDVSGSETTVIAEVEASPAQINVTLPDLSVFPTDAFILSLWVPVTLA